MKKIFLLLSFFVSLANAYSLERHVTSEPMVRGILLEEFTGIHCGYCPQGHAIAHAMMSMHPNQVNVIAVHAGSFAVPSTGEPEYRTEEGTAINDYFGINSYPSGMIDRHDYGYGQVSGRGYWTYSARLIQDEIADMNLWAQAIYDRSERNMTIDIEGLYVNNQPQEPVFVNVAITQSRIKGPQNGSQLGFNYPHNHMLRLMATPVEGEELSLDEDGFFSRSYNVVIPEKINDVEVDPLKLDVVVYVTIGRANVINSMTVHPSYKNFVMKGNLEISDDLIPHDGQALAGDSISLLLTNFTPNSIASIDYDVDVNGNALSKHIDFQKPMSPGEFRIVNFELSNGVGDCKAAISIRPTKANGEDIESNNIAINVLPAYNVATEGNLILRADRNFGDNLWSFSSFDGRTAITTVVDEYTGEELSFPYSIENGCYGVVEVLDIWGDGVLNPRGIVKLNDSNGNMQAQTLEISGFGTRIYVIGDQSKNPVDSLISIESQEGYKANAYYSIDGRYLGNELPTKYRGMVIEYSGHNVRKIVIDRQSN